VRDVVADRSAEFGIPPENRRPPKFNQLITYFPDPFQTDRRQLGGTIRSGPWRIGQISGAKDSQRSGKRSRHPFSWRELTAGKLANGEGRFVQEKALQVF